MVTGPIELFFDQMNKYSLKVLKLYCLFSSQSTPESWAQNSHDNIVTAENERMASVQMRELINNILQDTSKDMREQADRVENAFGRRIEEVAAAKAKMENQLQNVRFKLKSYIRKPMINLSYYCFKRPWMKLHAKKIT